MSVRTIAEAVLLWSGVAIELLACVGVAAARGPHARLHFTGLAVLGLVAIALAVLVRMSFSLVADKALLTAAVAVAVAPPISVGLGRAARFAQRGDWRRQDGAGDAAQR
jgi:multisubunit Na+/H+ antiporter MnhG subunit